MKTLVSFVLLVVFANGAFANDIAQTPLGEYVNKKDDSFTWKVRRTGTIGRGEFVEIIFTSQTWKDTRWQHQLFILKPSTVPDDCKQAMLFVTGGRWRDSHADPSNGKEELPREANRIAAVAEHFKTPIAVLLQVPFQPMFDGKYEDQIIALTFARFLKTGDNEWPLLLPMVKSAAKAMDVVQLASKDKWSLDLANFTVTGASKRGWTTWLIGAVDKRVNAIAPMVIDMLNMEKQLVHQKKSWGDVSYKINDYTELGLMEKMATKEGRELQKIVDPISYRTSLTQPKLLMIGTNDHYWPLDALNLYWGELNGPKHILYVPNNRHGLNDFVRVVGSLNALHQQAGNGLRLPEMDWKFTNGDNTLKLAVSSNVKPNKVQVWLARSDTRDFRDARWQSKECQKQSDNEFSYSMGTPESGYSAIFGEGVFAEHALPYFLSTNVRIVGGPKDAE